MTSEDYNKHILPVRDKIFRFSLRLLSSEAAAKDATQDVLMKLWNRRAKLSAVTNVEAYAMTMTKNLCYDVLKSKHHKTLELVHNSYSETNSGLGSQIEARDEVDLVKKFIDALPEQQRAIIQLRDVEQFSNKEIEDIMGMNSTSVRVALSRARKKIMNELKKTSAYGLQ
ncbi:RNA polymerase sigma factor [Psychroflexus gondwanensis]|jgi:RNA polymerase sigma-70 factor (ECF subfamily)|uniref:RNA polymerase sigma-70 factor n=1 Tax=Psychroflexus gondwanensis ACAM 44 TaxID=1189619 RepID=N1WYS3_9FLAO|nr:RNA polymerase sigma factor [Psychroflexus gondwanensis]EMY82342.1 RNA polymerase sigma-70 factor [Psychroflexus gondwanensis ACAM 44]TXE17542.1 RNA polymerase sigma factor [Psychroflexus gondwanensis]